jgi:esterase/lipase superfamily enzyme
MLFHMKHTALRLSLAAFCLITANNGHAQDCAAPPKANYKEQTTTDTVYFATNRASVGKSFGKEIGTMQYGSTSVTFTEPQTDSFFAGMDYAPLGWHTAPTIVLTQNELTANVSAHANSGRPLDPMRPSDSLIVYIHGFADDFHDALCRAAEIKHRARFEGSLILFSWPASPSLKWSNILSANKEYLHDSTNANDRRTIAALTDFLLALRQSFPASRTVLVAHSMGNQILMKALRQMPDAGGKPYRAVVMLAPDLSTKDLLADLPQLGLQAKRTVLYVDQKDRALEVSGIRNQGDRAGAVDVLDPNGRMETVDITDATAGFGYLHHADHLEGTALFDLFWNVVRDMPAECRRERGLAYRKSETLWVLNYADAGYSADSLNPSCRLPAGPAPPS